MNGKKHLERILKCGGYSILRDEFTEFLDLPGSELALFAKIYSYSLNDEEGGYFGTRKYLADRLGITVSMVAKGLDSLCRKGYIKKRKILRAEKMHPYYCVDLDEFEKLLDEKIEKNHKKKIV